MIRMQDLKLKGKRVLIREDLNVPLKNGVITDDSRIRAALPTLKLALEKGAKVIVMSHLGRPIEGEIEERFSLAPVAARLAELLDVPVHLHKHWIEGVQAQTDSIILCENVRFEAGEKKNSDALARKMADLCDIFVNDAFATAHRAQASTHGVAKYVPTACAGPLLTAELDALAKALNNPSPPVVAIVGGSKVSSKLEVLESLLDKVDKLIVGGGIANTFLKAAGYPIGTSLCEDDLLETASKLMRKAEASKVEIPLPVDVVCGKVFDEHTPAETKAIEEVADNDLILDVGPQTARKIADLLPAASTIIWNGPLGVFEFEQFSDGTETLALAIAASPGFSIAGGGDTLAAIAKYQIAEQISYISTGGGAFLELVEGKELPAIDILQERARAHPDYIHPSEGY